MAIARAGKLPPVEKEIEIQRPLIPWQELPEMINL